MMSMSHHNTVEPAQSLMAEEAVLSLMVEEAVLNQMAGEPPRSSTHCRSRGLVLTTMALVERSSKELAQLRSLSCKSFRNKAE